MHRGKKRLKGFLEKSSTKKKRHLSKQPALIQAAQLATTLSIPYATCPSQAFHMSQVLYCLIMYTLTLPQGPLYHTYHNNSCAKRLSISLWITN